MNAARWAEKAFTPQARKDFLDMEVNWLSLARGYEFAERLWRFGAVHRIRHKKK